MLAIFIIKVSFNLRILLNKYYYYHYYYYYYYNIITENRLRHASGSLHAKHRFRYIYGGMLIFFFKLNLLPPYSLWWQRDNFPIIKRLFVFISHVDPLKVLLNPKGSLLPWFRKPVLHPRFRLLDIHPSKASKYQFFIQVENNLC